MALRPLVEQTGLHEAGRGVRNGSVSGIGLWRKFGHGRTSYDIDCCTDYDCCTDNDCGTDNDCCTDNDCGTDNEDHCCAHDDCGTDNDDHCCAHDDCGTDNDHSHPYGGGPSYNHPVRSSVRSWRPSR